MPVEPVSYGANEYEVGAKELEEYNNIKTNKVFFKAFDGMGPTETWNPRNFQNEKINLVNAGYIDIDTDADIKTFTFIPMRTNLGSG